MKNKTFNHELWESQEQKDKWQLKFALCLLFGAIIILLVALH